MTWRKIAAVAVFLFLGSRMPPGTHSSTTLRAPQALPDAFDVTAANTTVKQVWTCSSAGTVGGTCFSNFPKDRATLAFVCRELSVVGTSICL